MSRTRSPKRFRVALAYPAAVPWMALFARGVFDYAERHGPWNLTTSPPTLSGADEYALDISSLTGWSGDGVIAAVNTPAEQRRARRLGIPVVNLGGSQEQSALPRVMVDHQAIGRLAAEHLLERGLRRLAYCGFAELWYSRERCRGFVERAAQAGVSVEVFNAPHAARQPTSWQRRIDPLARWLRSLRPPMGLLAIHDYRARIVIDQCLELGLRVPHDVAVIGVDNDTTVCDYGTPTLSSVSRSAWRVGYEAARLLDRLMRGLPAAGELLIAPDGIVARQSTDTVAVEDPRVAAALHFVHDHVSQAFGVREVVRAAGISRRQLEQRFQAALNCTPHDYVCRARVERARQLLVETPRVKVRAIATACGFRSADRLRLVFQRVAGMTPLEYRQTQAGPAAK
jgi:LacI family transcriptional regulator